MGVYMPGFRVNLLALAAGLAITPAGAQQATPGFYDGRQITIVVASTPGGGYDTYARLVARHMPRHIPGAPRMIVSNMSGAGGNMAASYIVNAVPQDGTSMALVLPPTITGGLYESVQKLHYDPARLQHIGSAKSEVDMCFLRADTGVKSFTDLYSREIIVGGSAEGSVSRTQPVILNNLLGTRLRIVSGYPGTRQIIMAIESGEVAGVCGISYAGMALQKPDWIRDGFIKPLVQNNVEGAKTANDLGVPRSPDFAKSEEDRQVMELIFAQQAFGRPFVTGPAVPQDRVTVLRRAFAAAMTDAALLADAAALKIDIDPVSGEELQSLAARLYSMPQHLVDRAKDAQIQRDAK